MRSRYSDIEKGYLYHVNRPTNENPQFDTRQILELAVAVNRKQGFVKSGFGYTITNDDNGKYLPEDEWKVIEDNKTVIHNHLKGKKKVRVTVKDKEMADDMLSHYKGLAMKKLSGETNDFENNALMYTDAEKVDRLGVAIIASLPKSYKSDIRTRALAEDAEYSEYVGILKKRGKFTIKVRDTRQFDFGRLVICIEGDANIIKFFFNKDLKENGIAIGKVLNITGYVKDQSVSKYSKLKETVLNRVKVENK